VAVFPLGAALAAATMRWPVLARAVPMAAGVVVLLAGALQFGAWKIRWLACCRAAPGRGRGLPANAVTAWRHGLLLGLHCSYCCVGLTATWLVIGVMDLRAMAAVAAATTFERLAADSPRAARFVGLLMLATGMALVAHAARPG
jgi:predicted metal-binding membrane protein